MTAVATREVKIERAPRTYVRYRARLSRPDEGDVVSDLFKGSKHALRDLVNILVDQKIIVIEPVHVRRKQDVRFEVVGQ